MAWASPAGEISAVANLAPSEATVKLDIKNPSLRAPRAAVISFNILVIDPDALEKALTLARCVNKFFMVCHPVAGEF
jgi:hypothetical protein